MTERMDTIHIKIYFSLLFFSFGKNLNQNNYTVYLVLAYGIRIFIALAQSNRQNDIKLNQT